jgi:hypothetical protein
MVPNVLSNASLSCMYVSLSRKIPCCLMQTGMHFNAAHHCGVLAPCHPFPAGASDLGGGAQGGSRLPKPVQREGVVPP